MSSRATILYDLLSTPLTLNRAATEALIDGFLLDYDNNPGNLDTDALGILNLFYPEPTNYPQPPMGASPPPYPGTILKENRAYTFYLLKFNNSLTGRSQIKNIMTGGGSGSIAFTIDDSGGPINHEFSFIFSNINATVTVDWGDATSETLTAPNFATRYEFAKNFACPGTITVTWTGADMTLLDCFTNDITAISELPSAIIYLDCGENLMTTPPDISTLNNPFDFFIYDNLLTGAFNAIAGNTVIRVIDVSDNAGITSVGFNGCSGLEEIYVSNVPITVFAPTGLSSILNIQLFNTSVTALDFSPYSTLTTYNVSSCASLATLDIHGLVNLGQVYQNNCALTTINAQNCNFSNFFCTGNTASLSVDVSGSDINSQFEVEGSNVTSCNLSGITNAALIRLRNNTISTANVNSILAQCVASGLLSKNLQIENQTPAAPPSGQGIIDKADLISDGWSVTTD